MKKLLLLFSLVVIMANGYSQQYTDTIMYLQDAANDTTFPLVISDDYVAAIHFKWGGLTGTLDGIVKIEQAASDSGLYIEDYVWCGTVETDYIDTIQTAYGNTLFLFEYTGMRKIRIKWIDNNISAGWIKANITLRRK